MTEDFLWHKAGRGRREHSADVMRVEESGRLTGIVVQRAVVFGDNGHASSCHLIESAANRAVGACGVKSKTSAC